MPELGGDDVLISSIKHSEIASQRAAEADGTSHESSEKSTSAEMIKIMEGSRYLKGIVGVAFGQTMSLAPQLDITDVGELEYMTLLIGKELIADRQARRRHTSIIDEEVTDEWLKRSGRLRGKTIEDEKAYDEIVTSVEEKTSVSSGEQRAKMIRTAIHNLFSIALAEGRKSEESSRYAEKGAPRIRVKDKGELAREVIYWKEQIASSPPQVR